MLAATRAFVFDLDGCVWNGATLNPGAADVLTRLVHAGRRVAFLTNNSRATSADILARLRSLGVTVAEHALTPLDIIGIVIRERFGPSRVLVIGAAEMADVIRREHEIVDVKDIGGERRAAERIRHQ